MLAKYLVRRLLAGVVTMVGVSMLIFVIARVVPGDPARMALGPQATREAVEKLRNELFLNEPLWVQYWEYVKGVSHGDLGISLFTNQAVTDDLIGAFPATFELILVSSFLMIFIGIPLGTVAARFRDGWFDNFTRLFSLLGLVTPNFVWSVFLVLVFAYWYELMPVADRLSESTAPPPLVTGLYLVDSLLAGQWETFKDAAQHIVMPAVALSLASIGQTTRLTRANVGESYQRNYIEFARAYGFSEFRTATRYALRPALIPTLTVLGLDIAVKLGSAFLVETVFVWPGMARYGVQVILNKDLNAIVGTVLVIAAFFLIINLIIDLLVAFVDPRIRLGARAQ